MRPWCEVHNFSTSREAGHKAHPHAGPPQPQPHSTGPPQQQPHSTPTCWGPSEQAAAALVPSSWVHHPLQTNACSAASLWLRRPLLAHTIPSVFSRSFLVHILLLIYWTLMDGRPPGCHGHHQQRIAHALVVRQHLQLPKVQQCHLDATRGVRQGHEVAWVRVCVEHPLE